MKHNLVYKQLKQILEGLGYQADTVNLDMNGHAVKSIVFRRKGSDMYIILPYMRPEKVVHPAHLQRVKDVLEDEGFWADLVEQTKTDNRDEAVRVLQTLAGIKATG